MIYGIGIDIVHIPRIFRVLQKYGKKFLNRVYTEQEIEIGNKYNNQELLARYLAKRFAAKESFVKALGTGLNHGISMKDIAIYNDVSGKPYIRTNFIPQNRAIHLSMSDDNEYATAFVIISKV